MPEQQRLPKEIRFAVVMYGGVSLAIYINGVTQELMSMVRATAPKKDDPSGAYHLDQVKGVEGVYRQLGEYLGARFVVDILAGTSAGGINAVYLAKALANDQNIDQLKNLWIKEGDIERLVNDRESLNGLEGQSLSDSPASLLNSQRMYYQLLTALQDMETKRPSAEGRFSPYVDELDLFITATDLQGLSVPVRSSRREVARERRYRNVFQFRYCTSAAAGSAAPNEEDKPLNEFLEKHDPFLAFAARCTSSFPFAFEPMRLKQVDQVIGRSPFNKYKYTTKDWSGFYKDYEEETFPQMPFGDGGYLDNKPFSYATATLSRRRADLPVDRKLVYIEPAPEEIDDKSKSPLGSPDAFENVLLALTKLPRYETIREDLDAVNKRNRVIHDVNTVLRNIEAIYTVERQRKEDPKLVSRKPNEAQRPTPPWRKQFLNHMIKVYGAGYIPYHELRVQEVLDNLSAMLARGMGWAEDSPQAADLRVLLHEWRKAYYKSNANEEDPPTGIKRKSENDLLFRLDSGWYIRRLHYLRGLVDALLKDMGDNRFGAVGSPSKSILDHSQAQWNVQSHLVDYHSALLQVKKKLNDAFALLRGRGRAMRRRNLVQVTSAPDNALDDYRAQLQGLKEFLETERQAVAKTAMPQSVDGASRIPASETTTTQLDALVQFTVQRAREPELQAPTTFGEALQRLEKVTAVLTDRDRNGLIYAALDETSDRIQVALGRRPRATELEEVSMGNDPRLQEVQACLAFYDDHFEDFDMLTFPISYGTDVGESDEVEIVRISPNDATMIKGEGYGSRKLAGTKLGNFGAFFNRSWRENDMVWGRLDAVECLIKAVWPEGEPIDKRDEFIKEAHDIIIEEFMMERPHNALLESLSTGARILKKKELETAISAVLTDRKKLNEYFREKYEPDPNFPADSTVKAAARSTRVLGRLLAGLSDKYPVVSEPAGILARTGRFVFFVLSIADPRTLWAQIFLRLLVVAYLLGFGIMSVGTILTQWKLPQGATFSEFGARVVVGTLVVQLLALIANRFMTSRLNLKTILWIAASIFIVLFLAALLVASYSGMVYLGIWEAPDPAGMLGRLLETLKNIFNP